MRFKIRKKSVEELLKKAEQLYKTKCETLGKDHPETYVAMLRYVEISARAEGFTEIESSEE